MTSEEYQKLKSVFQSVLEIEPHKRADFLDKSCGDDTNLRQAVEKLLKKQEDGTVSDSAIRNVDYSASDKSFAEGEKIGRYEIQKRLGKGGMGEVYLAHDKSLGRDVAIKVLLPEYTSDAERINRFKLEAKAASALNHPNIITIYEIREDADRVFIVTEYVKGKTLAEILETERLNIGQAIDWAIQIADALDEAHSAYIIHRDIKPSNIIVNNKGQIKILDFGLAKFIEGETESGISKKLSVSGAILGTVPYMSPEQLRARPLDTRTDIFSFGALFYEMLTGFSPFRMESNAEIISAILNDEPNFTNIPQELKPIVKKTLIKDKEKRYQKIGELLTDLRRVRENASQKIKTESEIWSDLPTVKLTNYQTNEQEEAIVTSESDKKSFRTGNSRKWIFAVSGLTVLLFAGAAIWYFLPAKKVSPNNLAVSQFVNWKRDLGEDLGSSARFSPDGKVVAYSSTRSGVSAIWLKQVGGGEPFTRKQDKWLDRNPLFSPDGQQIAFLSEREGQTGIWSMPMLGGSAVLLKTLEGGGQNLLRWSKDGTKIYFEQGKNLFQIELPSKTITQLANFDSWQFTRLRSDISPDEERLAFIAKQDGKSDIWITSKNGENPVRLTNDNFEEGYLVWHPDGKRIIYDSVRNGISQIFAAELDGSAPVQLIFSDNPNYVSDISPDGNRIIYHSQRDESDIWKVSLDDSKEIRLSENISAEMWTDSSPDGKSFVYQAEKTVDVSRRIVNSLIFSQSSEGGQPLQLTDDGYLPMWSPNGKNIAFLRSSEGLTNLWTVPSAGGESRPLTYDGITFGGYAMLPFNRVQTQDYQWSPDGSQIVFCARRGNISNLWQTESNGGGEQQLTENSDNRMWFNNPAFSPDGQKIAFLALAMPTIEQKERKWSVQIYEAGKTKTLYESDKILGIIGWSETGKEIYLKTSKTGKATSPFAEEVEIFQVSAENGAARPLFHLESAYLKNISLSPDKQSIGYVGRKDGMDGIRIFSIKNGTERTVLQSNDSRVYFANIAWSADNKTIFFSKQLSWQIFSMIENYK